MYTIVASCTSVSHCLVVFFYKQKTAYDMRISDWSSDVCSSDLLLKAPKALPFEAATCDGDCAATQRPATIGALAEEQSKGSCDAKLTYSNDWAKRLPAAFRVYPRATVREAAGVNGGKCNRSDEHTSELQSLMRI